MEQRTLLALVAVLAFWVVNTLLWNYSLFDVTLPLVGTIFDFKPFQLIAPYSVFIGAIIVILVYKVTKR